MLGIEFLRRTRRYARIHGLAWQWQPKLGKGSHGVLRVGERWTTVRYLKDELKDGTLRAMLRQLGIRRDAL